jgi:glycosyltransferase involved in cell wall biosynthesis
MRVALLTPGYGPAHGILGRHVQELAAAAAREGNSVEVLLHAPPHSKVAPATDGISITRFPPLIPGSENALSGALWAHLRDRSADFDILHAHGEATLPALLAAHDVPRRTIFSPHWYASSQTRLRRLAQGRFYRLDGRVLRSADRVLCVSHSEALQVRRHVPEASVEIVPNGFDTESIVHARAFPIQPRVILSVDRLTRWAGIQRIISALMALPPSYRLVVVGHGRGRGVLEAHADYLGVADRVRFVGGVSDAVLYRWVRTASVLATLKEESLWGGTLLTAICAGTPAVASDIAANREAAVTCDHHGVGFVSRRASPFAVAEAVRQLAGAASRPCAGRVPTWEDTAQRTISIYRDVLGDGG